MAINDEGDSALLFVSNVLDGTITRLKVSFAHHTFSVKNSMTIAHGYAFGADPAAVVVGPAGLAYDRNRDILYVASELDNEIFELDGAGGPHDHRPWNWYRALFRFNGIYADPSD